MKPYFIALSLDKFQSCCYPGCYGDAIGEVITEPTEKGIYHLGYCSQELHKEGVELIASRLRRGKDPKNIHYSNLFIRPPGHEQKCKHAQWIESLANPEPAPQRKPPTHSDPLILKDWNWVPNFGKWMNSEGRVVPIKKLTNPELVDSALAIVSINFSRVTSRVRWTKDLYQPHVTFCFPEDSIDVGYKLAGTKLDELREEADARGMTS